MIPDGLFCGLAITLLSFYPIATIALLISPYINIMSMGGLKMFSKNFYWVPLGILIGLIFNEFNYYNQHHDMMTLISVIQLLVGVLSISYLNFITSLNLRQSRKLLKKAYQSSELEKQRSDNLLLNILPSEVATELKEKGEVSAKQIEGVSILFTDFKDFTRVTENLSPQELVSEINQYYKAFDSICERFDLEKIKTIGDSYMAAAGLPIPYEKSTQNVVMAALEMLDFVNQERQGKSPEIIMPFEIRIGIDTGKVVAGIVGLNKFQYDVWGDTVNIASRMETHGKEGKVNISQSTYHQIKDDPKFQFEHRGMVPVKGKGDMDMYFVSRTK